jgi:hypothetical protein
VVSDVRGLALGLVTVVLGVAAFGSFSVPPSLDLFPSDPQPLMAVARGGERR